MISNIKKVSFVLAATVIAQALIPTVSFAATDCSGLKNPLALIIAENDLKDQHKKVADAGIALGKISSQLQDTDSNRVILRSADTGGFILAGIATAFGGMIESGAAAPGPSPIANGLFGFEVIVEGGLVYFDVQNSRTRSQLQHKLAQGMANLSLMNGKIEAQEELVYDCEQALKK